MHGVVVLGIPVADVHDLALGHIEGHSPHVCPVHQPVQGCLKGVSVLLGRDRLRYLRVVRELDY